MLGKIIGAVIGERLAARRGESGAKGALKGAIAAAVVRRLGLPALAVVGGIAAYRQYKSSKAGAA